MRLAFMGTPEFSVSALDALVQAGHEIAAVYTQPPARAGRGKALRKSPVHIRADALGLPVHTPKTLKTQENQDAFASLNLDVAVVVAYGLILPRPILATPIYGCLNIHASLLPRWRGAAPIHRAVMAGDSETGVAIMQMEAGLDTGPVWASERLPIGPDDTTASLHDRLSLLGARMIVETLPHVTVDGAKPVPQATEGVTYAHKIDKAEAAIDWSQPASVIDRQVRGLYPFPGAWSLLHGERIKFLAGQVVEDKQATSDSQPTPGTIMDSAWTIACGTGAWRPTQVQRAGKAAMDVASVLRGLTVAPGDQMTREETGGAA